MAVFFWYLLKSGLSSVFVKCTLLLVYTGQVTLYKVPEQQGHVYLVTLYNKRGRWGGGLFLGVGRRPPLVSWMNNKNMP